MADDQATLETFADDGESPDADDGSPDADDDTAVHDDGEERTATGTTEGTPNAPSDDLVCPWCLAAAEAFVETGPTGWACGRCSATLPVDTDWFREREVIARRPMYAVEA